MKCFLLALLIVLSASVQAYAQSIDSVFANMPQTLNAVLDRTERLDLIDLYNSGQTARVENVFGGQSEMELKTANYLQLKNTDVSSWQIKKVPIERDSLLLCAYHINALGTSTVLRWFTCEWYPIKRELPAPKFEQFLTEKNAVSYLRSQALLPLLRQLPVVAKLEAATANITFMLDISSLSVDDRTDASLLLHGITYEWNGSKHILK